MTGPHTQLTHHYILLQYDRTHEHELLWPTVQHKQTHKQNPLIYQNYSKSKIMKNLARTLSLFLIFSENFYKSRTRNIVTELCYDRWFTTQTNDKVLIKQTKNQHCTYSCAGQKLTAWFSIHFWLKLLSNFYSTRPPPAIVRPLHVKFE